MARRQQREARAASPLPAPKRLKTTQTSHVPAHSGFGFLVDENARHGQKLDARLTNGVPSTKAARVDESYAVVAPDSNGKGRQNLKANLNPAGASTENAIDVSSGEESSSNDSSDDEEEEEDEDNEGPAQALVNGIAHDEEEDQDAVAGAEDTEMADATQDIDDNDEEEQEAASPSFGEMLQARHPETIDITSTLPNPALERQALIPHTTTRTLTLPTNTTLSTVLTQALKTNDKDLLETCFHTRDVPSIRATIQRLQPQHVTTLLQRLAERIHKRPGRTGSLLVWVQWSLIAHGGYLAAQPELMKQLKALSQVIRERANGLQPLLHLKGKLDLLSAQLELRRSLQAASRAAHEEDEDDEEGVVYVEGRGDDWEESEEEAEVGAVESVPRIEKRKAQTATPVTEDDSESSESEDGMLNGVVREEDDSEDDEQEEGLFDVEAEETEDDEDDEEESESEDAGESDDEGSDSASEGSEAERRPTAKLSRKR